MLKIKQKIDKGKPIFKAYLLLEILLELMLLCLLALNRPSVKVLFFKCLVFLPCTRLRHSLKLEGLS